MCEEPECADCFVAFATLDELRRHHLERHSARMPRWVGGWVRGWVGGTLCLAAIMLLLLEAVVVVVVVLLLLVLRAGLGSQL